MDSNRQDHLKEIRHTHIRRLQVLERQAALTGVSARPEVILEIEDIRAAITEIDAELATFTIFVSQPTSERMPSGQQQRKQVTVLNTIFGKLNGLSAQYDPEEFVEVLDRLWQQIDQEVERYGGRVIQHTTNAIVAVWGAFVAREDDAEQAIHAGLALGTTVVAFCSAEKLNLTLHSGISTGTAVLGAIGSASEFSIIGEPVTAAAELAAVAGNGEVLVAEETFRHVRGLFEVQTLQTRQVAHRAEPFRIYRIQSVRPPEFRPATRGIEGILTAMVGRDAEMHTLQNLLEAMLEDHDRVVVTITGDAGLGKSRLLAEFDTWVSQQQPIIELRGRASPTSQQQPYALLRDMVARHCDIQDNDPIPHVRAKLEQRFGMVLGTSADAQTQAAIIGHLLGFHVGESLPIGITDDAKQIRDRGVHGLLTYIRKLADHTPVLLMLEDIHWADDASLDIGTELVEALDQAQLMVICAARPNLYERRQHWGEGQ